MEADPTKACNPGDATGYMRLKVAAKGHRIK
jgi:hypothetical protein